MRWCETSLPMPDEGWGLRAFDPREAWGASGQGQWLGRAWRRCAPRPGVSAVRCRDGISKMLWIEGAFWWGGWCELAPVEGAVDAPGPAAPKRRI